MAQVNFLFSDDNDTFVAVNGNGTSAITAGDILYASGSTAAKLGTTVPSGLNYNDIEVEPIKFATATTQGHSVVGVAEEDAAAGSQVTVRTRGMWFSPIDATTCPLRAGNAIRANEGTTSAGGATNVATGEWTHGGGVYNDTDIRVYRNGSLDNNGASNPRTYSAGISEEPSVFAIGAYFNGYPTSAREIDGHVDDVGVFDRELSSTEVDDIYTNGMAGVAAVGYGAQVI